MNRLGILSFSLFLLFILSSRGNSQVELWETFSDMKTINSIEIVSDRNLIYCASEGGLFSLNLNTGEVLKKYTNITGLATLSAKSIKVDNHGRLWVAVVMVQFLYLT